MTDTLTPLIDTTTDWATVRAALEAEFPPEKLDEVRKGGSRITYVPIAEVVQRLNDVFGPGRWGWKAANIWRDTVSTDWVLCFGVLTVKFWGEAAELNGEGGVQVKMRSDGSGLVDLGDEFKGASSEALKKAAQRIGIGLYLARSDEARRYEAPASVRDAVEEGWESTEERKLYVDEFARRVKAIGGRVQAVMAQERERLGVVWPPTKDEYEELMVTLDTVMEQEGVEEPLSGPVTAGGAGDGWSTPEARTEALDALTKRLGSFPEEDLQTIGEWRAQVGLDHWPLSKREHDRLVAFVEPLEGDAPAA